GRRPRRPRRRRRPRGGRRPADRGHPPGRRPRPGPPWPGPPGQRAPVGGPPPRRVPRSPVPGPRPVSGRRPSPRSGVPHGARTPVRNAGCREGAGVRLRTGAGPGAFWRSFTGIQRKRNAGLRTSAGGRGRTEPRLVAVCAGYALRACFPTKRRIGLVLPAAGALLFALLARLIPDSAPVALAQVADGGLFGVVLPVGCLVIGDAVLGAEVRSGTLHFTWLSPVSFATVVAGRWLAGAAVAVAAL